MNFNEYINKWPPINAGNVNSGKVSEWIVTNDQL